MAEEVDVFAHRAGHAGHDLRAQVGIPDDEQSRATIGALHHLGHRGDQVLHTLARIEATDEQDVGEVRIAPLGERRHERMEAVHVDAIRDHMVGTRMIELGGGECRARHRDARIEAFHRAHDHGLEQVLQRGATAGRVERTHGGPVRDLRREQRQRRRGGAVDVHDVEVEVTDRALEASLERQPDREVHERAVERHEDVPADAQHAVLEALLTPAEEARDDGDLVAPLAQLVGQRVHVLGHAAVARVVGLRDDADPHASTRCATPRGAASAAAEGSLQNGRKMHHWSRFSRMWRSATLATA